MLAITSKPGALDLFWFPMLVFTFGLVLSITRNHENIKKMGFFLTVIGVIFISITPFTLPDSPSSAFGQLISLIIGPIILLNIAIRYSNRLKINNFSEYLKLSLIVFAISWILLIWLIGPEINNSPNKYWQIWIIGIQISFALILFFHSYFEKRITSKFLFLILGISILLLNEERLNIPNSSRFIFIDVFGVMIGTSIGIICGLILWYSLTEKIFSFNKELEMDSELNMEERTLLFEKLNNNLNWINKDIEGEKND